MKIQKFEAYKLMDGFFKECSKWLTAICKGLPSKSYAVPLNSPEASSLRARSNKYSCLHAHIRPIWVPPNVRGNGGWDVRLNKSKIADVN